MSVARQDYQRGFAIVGYGTIPRVGSGSPRCRCARCSIAARASRRRSRSSSTARSFRSACGGTARRGAILCGSRRRRAKSCCTIPPRGTLKEAREFAEKHGGWIAARLGRLPQAAPFADGVVVPLRGEPHRITHRHGARGTVWTESDGNGERLLCVAGQRRTSTAASPIFCSAKPSAILRPPAAALRRDLGLTVKRVSVRDQSSRWGSCSTTGVLSFSWRLILAPSLCARLPRRPRGGASRRNEPFGTVLARGEAAVPGSSNGQGLARCPWGRSAPLWFARGQPAADREADRLVQFLPAELAGRPERRLRARRSLTQQITLNRDPHCILRARPYFPSIKADRAAPHPPTPRRPVR